MFYLRIVAFTSGLVVLAIEITAFRIVAPFFGNSIFITTNLLGVILAALALGYWLGGRLADRTHSARPLFLLMLVTACLTALIPFIAPALLGALRSMLESIDWKLIVISLGGSFILFFIPFTLLGMVSPWLVRLSNRSVEQTGRTAGSLYALSTLGSLVGTFLPTLLTVPLIGTKRSILLFSTLLSIVAAIGLIKKRWLAPTVVLLLAVAFTHPSYYASADVLAERESALEYLRVVKEGDTVHLEQDEGFGIHSVYNPEKILTGLVFDWFTLAPALLNSSQEKSKESLDVGIVGLAAGTAARQYEHFYGRDGADPRTLSITGVEVDGEVIDLAREYFGLNEIDPETLDVVVADGRVWLEQSEQKFDVLILDAFRQLYIPSHLSSREYFSLAADHLNENGVLVVNLNVTSRDSLVYKKMATTLQSVFPHVLTVEVPQSFNVVFYASQQELSADRVATVNKVSVLQPLAQRFSEIAQPLTISENDWFIATDDRPLVESLFDVMVAQSLF
jgi:predicted membrane-bound spermidine synthase